MDDVFVEVVKGINYVINLFWAVGVEIAFILLIGLRSMNP